MTDLSDLTAHYEFLARIGGKDHPTGYPEHLTEISADEFMGGTTASSRWKSGLSVSWFDGLLQWQAGNCPLYLRRKPFCQLAHRFPQLADRVVVPANRQGPRRIEGSLDTPVGRQECVATAGDYTGAISRVESIELHAE